MKHRVSVTRFNVVVAGFLSFPFLSFLFPSVCNFVPFLDRRHSPAREVPTILSRSVLEVRPLPLTSISEPFPVFDGTTRLYICYLCPYAQRAWITRNCKGLQDKIKLVPIDLKNRPSWYKDKVYPQNKVPSLEHNGKVLGESLDLIRYIDANFEGPALFPKQLISHVNTFTGGIYPSFKGDAVQQTSAAFDYLENALGKFDDGPFFLGQFSLADIAYVSFLERFQMIFSEIFNHDITAGRPKLAAWIEEANKIDGYKQTKVDRKEYLEAFKKKFMELGKEDLKFSPLTWSVVDSIASRSYQLEVTKHHSTLHHIRSLLFRNIVRSMATAGLEEIRPPTLSATSEPPPLFDGTTRLYMSYSCPFAQRVWITRNQKGLQDKIKLVPIDLLNIPAWYKEKVHPENKVPSFEHDGKVLAESIDLIKYIDTNFEGPSLFPNDSATKEFGEELIKYVDTFTKTVFGSFSGADPVAQASVSFDYVENALGKFDGPFFLGEFSLVDIAYIPFVERFQILFFELYKYDITVGRPKLTAWIEALNNINAYKQTKLLDPQEFVAFIKKRFGVGN
ncbi:hypothetical protein VNO77_17568 [Canavalia gladiata]|uniref:glutathione transferase n=1 Tax=Canavalia gladiata TaxID=3824 RepID=A0AAN9QJH2_CANGL